MDTISRGQWGRYWKSLAVGWEREVLSLLSLEEMLCLLSRRYLSKVWEQSKQPESNFRKDTLWVGKPTRREKNWARIPRTFNQARRRNIGCVLRPVLKQEENCNWELQPKDTKDQILSEAQPHIEVPSCSTVWFSTVSESSSWKKFCVCETPFLIYWYSLSFKSYCQIWTTKIYAWEC